MAEIGASGLNAAVGGQIQEELHPKLSGRQALETWRQMKDNDALIGAILFTIDMLVRQVEWSVDQKDADEADSEFLESCMDDMSMSWGDFISEIMSMLPFGFAFHEIVYKKRNGPKPSARDDGATSRFNDGRWGWRKMPLRAQETLDHWDFDEQGGLKAFVQKAPPDYRDVPIPIEKGLLFRTSVYKNNPEGRSILRSAYTSWYYKKHLQAAEGTGIERYLAGFPVFWIPAEYMAADPTVEQQAVVNQFKSIGENIRRDRQEFLIMPLAYGENGQKAFDFTLTASGGSRVFDTSAIIQRYNQEIAMSALADFMLLGHEKVGSFALSSDKTDLFAVALGTILDGIADVLNRYAVPRLFELNGLDLENLPEIRHGDIEKPDLQALSTYLSALSGLGMPMFPDEDLEAWLREVGGLPEKSEDTKRLQEEQQDTGEEDESSGSDGSGPEGPGGSGSEGPQRPGGRPQNRAGADNAGEAGTGPGDETAGGADRTA